MKFTVNVRERQNELKNSAKLRVKTPLLADEQLLTDYGQENGKLLIGVRNMMLVFTQQLKVFPELAEVVLTDDPDSAVFYAPSQGGYNAYLSSGFVIRYFNFISYSLSCSDVLPEFQVRQRDLERQFDMVSEQLEKIMERELTSVSGTSDDHASLCTLVTLSGLLSIICHEIIHLARDHAALRRPFMMAQTDEMWTSISKNGLNEFSNIRSKDYEMASFFRALEFDADYHSWPNALQRTKILCELFEQYFSLSADPYELTLIGLHTLQIYAAHYEASNLDVDLDLGTTFRTHPTATNRLLFLRKMLGHLLQNGAFERSDTLYLSDALQRVVEELGGMKPYPLRAYDVMQRDDQAIMLKDFENFRKIASA